MPPFLAVNSNTCLFYKLQLTANKRLLRVCRVSISWSGLTAPSTDAEVHVLSNQGRLDIKRYLAFIHYMPSRWVSVGFQINRYLNLQSQSHEVFMRTAGSGIPGKSVDDVRQHDEWYSEYLILKESKKKAIQEWKEGKEV